MSLKHAGKKRYRAIPIRTSSGSILHKNYVRSSSRHPAPHVSQRAQGVGSEKTRSGRNEMLAPAYLVAFSCSPSVLALVPVSAWASARTEGLHENATDRK